MNQGGQEGDFKGDLGGGTPQLCKQVETCVWRPSVCRLVTMCGFLEGYEQPDLVKREK